MPRGGRLTIETANVDLDEPYARLHPEVHPGQYVLMTMSDTGRRHLTPAVRGRGSLNRSSPPNPSGRAPAWALRWAHGIVKQSGGYIEVYSEPGIGTDVQGLFSGHRGSGGDRRVVARAWAGAQGHRHDSAGGRRSRRAGLPLLALAESRLHGAGGRQPTRGHAAYRAATAGSIDLLATDDDHARGQRPHELGGGTADQAFSQKMKVLYMSGYTDDAVVRHGLLQAEVSFLQKFY